MGSRTLSDVFGLIALIVHMPSRSTYDDFGCLVDGIFVNHLSLGVEKLFLKGESCCTVK